MRVGAVSQPRSFRPLSGSPRNPGFRLCPLLSLKGFSTGHRVGPLVFALRNDDTFSLTDVWRWQCPLNYLRNSRCRLSGPVRSFRFLANRPTPQYIYGYRSETTRMEIPAKHRTTQCVHQRFEQQAHRTPDAPAVRFENDVLSFSELNSRANRQAELLRAAGVGAEVPVALFVERSLDLVVALLGILKAGGAYVPLDTDQPSQRQAFILENCQPAALVTQGHLKLNALGDSTRLVYCDAARSAGEPEPLENHQTTVGLRNLAYILYTSGTTGRPKGVAVEHRQLMNYLESAADTYHLSTSASFAMAQTIAVDTCITTLYTPLVHGGTLHLLSRERSLDPDALAEYGRQHRIDCLKIAPSHLAVLLDSPHAADCLPQQHLVLGGEPPSWELIERVRALRPACAIINEYGPTETTVGVIAARLDKGITTRTSTTPPIGIPIGGNYAYYSISACNR